MVVFLSICTFAALVVIAYLIFNHKREKSDLTAKFQETAVALDAEKALQVSLQQELAGLQDQLNRTHTDPVTNLLSWQLFEDRLSQHIKESERYQLTMGVVVVDIDDFKVINDALGYEVGDALLLDAAKRLNTCIRQVDSISRKSKDRFVIVLAQLAKPETAALVTQRMLQAMTQPFQIQEHELYITACIGVAVYPADGQDVTTLLTNAESALQMAKAKDKNTYQFYQENIHMNSQRELLIFTNLRRETLFKELVLHYQPIQNIQDGTIFAMQAQLYWQHPDIGLIEPKELFGYADRQKKITVLLEWLVEHACKSFLSWRSNGFCPDHIALPVSAKVLENSHFVYRISQILQDMNFKPEWLIFEITDSFSQIPYDVLEKSINMLKYLGIKLVIDDFGSGAISFCQLKHIPVNYFKIAADLTNDLESNYGSQALVKSIIFMAKNLSVDVIAQNVATDKQMEILLQSGCLYIQGPLAGGEIPQESVLSTMLAPSPERG